jgi:hypothetical protein
MNSMKYKGRFNLFGCTREYYRYASSRQQAKLLMLKSLAKDSGYVLAFLGNYFNGVNDNYKIVEVA